MGCAANQAALTPRVTLVATSTPGVKYVIVRPAIAQQSGVVGGRDRDGADVDPRSEYILFCDGRRADGMVCQVVSEVGENRRSIAPQAAKGGTAVSFPVGTLDTTIEITHVEKRAGADQKPPAPAAPTATTSSAPPPPPPPAGH